MLDHSRITAAPLAAYSYRPKSYERSSAAEMRQRRAGRKIRRKALKSLICRKEK
jgi:hypothetical protein